MSERIKSCFISAPFSTNIEALRSALTARNVGILGIQDMPVGESISVGIRNSIRNADLFIAVLGHTTNHNVIFEIGIATALDKKILIFAPPKGDVLPSDLLGATYIRTNLKNREAIDFVLDQLIASSSVPRRQSQVTRSQVSKPLLNAYDFQVELADLLVRGTGRDFESLVTRALRQTGVEVVVPGPRDRGADLIVWSDDLQPYVGNPFPIEIKRRLDSRDAARRALAATASATTAVGSSWGLLLYGEGPSDNDRVLASQPFILAISLRGLFEKLGVSGFADIIRMLRNRRVHGGDR